MKETADSEFRIVLESSFQRVGTDCEKARWPQLFVCIEGMHSVQVQVTYHCPGVGVIWTICQAVVVSVVAGRCISITSCTGWSSLSW